MKATTVRFDVQGLAPVPQGSMRSYGRGRMVHSNAKTLTPWRGAVTNEAHRAAGGLFFPEHTPVMVEIRFRLARPKSVTVHERPMPTARSGGDIDKLARAVLDALTGVLYHDDSQVCALVVLSTYAMPHESVGATVTVTNMLELRVGA